MMIEMFSDITLSRLQKCTNEFAKDKDVVDIRLHTNGNVYVTLVIYNDYSSFDEIGATSTFSDVLCNVCDTFTINKGDDVEKV